MPGAITLRPARPGESEALSELALRSKAYWKYSPEFIEACRAELAVSEEALVDPRSRYVLAESEGAVVGYYALICDPAGSFELDALFVRPENIGQGIGRALIEHAKDCARTLGAASITIQGDPHAADFYLAAGGVQVGESESQSIPGRSLPEFRIRLDPPSVTSGR